MSDLIEFNDPFSEYFSYTAVGLLFISFILWFFSYVYSLCNKANSTKSISWIVLGLYSLNVYIDIVFIYWEFGLNIKEYINDWMTLLLGILAILIIFIPRIIMIIVVFKKIPVWMKDMYIKQRINEYFNDYSKFFKILCIITMSPYGSLMICNAFNCGLNHFRMGLSDVEFYKFMRHRLFSITLFHVCGYIIYVFLRYIDIYNIFLKYIEYWNDCHCYCNMDNGFIF